MATKAKKAKPKNPSIYDSVHSHLFAEAVEAVDRLRDSLEETSDKDLQAQRDEVLDALDALIADVGFDA